MYIFCTFKIKLSFVDILARRTVTKNITIFQQSADQDLVSRLSGLKQCPETGRLYTRNQWNQNDLVSRKKTGDEEVDDKDENKVGLFNFSCFLVYSVIYILPKLYRNCPLLVYRVQK